MSPGGVIFAGGGTGGHIFPAIAIAEQLRLHDRSAEHPSPPIAFLCSTRDIDRRILEPRGVDFTAVPAAPFALAPSALARFALGWRASVRACEAAIRARCDAWGSPPSGCVLVATGGFVCAPAAAAARRLGLKTVLVNLDAVPGKAGRLLARKADAVFTTYPAFGLEPVGPIVRAEARPPHPPEGCRERLGLDPHRPTLVVSGASQGATSINDFVLELARTRPDIFEGWQILHQAGPDRAQAVEAAYAHTAIPHRVVGLVDEAGLLWGAGTLALARAGAGTVAEIRAAGLYALFMPYPYHKDQHQRLNALPAVREGLAEILDDRITPAANAAEHGDLIAQRLRDPPQKTPQSTIPPDGAAKIAASLNRL